MIVILVIGVEIRCIRHPATLLKDGGTICVLAFCDDIEVGVVRKSFPGELQQEGEFSQSQSVQFNCSCRRRHIFVSDDLKR